MSDQTAVIREIAEDVYKTLGCGFSEEVYDRAMQVVAAARLQHPFLGDVFTPTPDAKGNAKILTPETTLRDRHHGTLGRLGSGASAAKKSLRARAEPD